jgi:uncharacterized protein
MKRDDALRILADHREELRGFRVKSLSLFGSVARDEATDASDVDLLVEFEEGAHVGLFGFIDVKLFLEDVLECKVDLVMPDALRKEFKEEVLKEAIRAA